MTHVFVLFEIWSQLGPGMHWKDVLYQWHECSDKVEAVGDVASGDPGSAAPLLSRIELVANCGFYYI